MTVVLLLLPLRLLIITQIRSLERVQELIRLRVRVDRAERRRVLAERMHAAVDTLPVEQIRVDGLFT